MEAGVPEWVTWIGIGIGTMLAAFVARMGWKSADPAKPRREIELAGALVDSESIKVLAASIEALAFTMKELESKMHGPARERRESAEDTIEALRSHTRELNELRHELREIRGEMASRPR